MPNAHAGTGRPDGVSCKITGSGTMDSDIAVMMISSSPGAGQGPSSTTIYIHRVSVLEYIHVHLRGRNCKK